MTRCQIIVHGHDASIYVHNDGYPNGTEGILHRILPYIKAFVEARGQLDPSYLTARLMGHLAILADKWFKKFIKGRNPKDFADMQFTNFGIDGHTGTFHGDEDYIYVIKENHVEVRRCVRGFSADATLANTDLIRCVDFDGKDYKATPARRRRKEMVA